MNARLTSWLSIGHGFVAAVVAIILAALLRRLAVEAVLLVLRRYARRSLPPARCTPAEALGEPAHAEGRRQLAEAIGEANRDV